MLLEGNVYWIVQATTCPACKRVSVFLEEMEGFSGLPHRKRWRRMVRPKGVARSPLPAEVPGEFASDYLEACNVLADSPKASAALSRRCLQKLLRDHAKFEQRDLYDQIEAALKSKMLPSDIADDLDAVRVVGNFAAHPLKRTNTGEIVEVEPGEAEWNLEVLEQLFDFYFVRPLLSRKRRDKLDKKLDEAGKPPLRKA
jgi:hypothetical protein